MVTPHHLPLFPRLSTCTSCALHIRATSVGVPTCWIPSTLSPSPSTPSLLFLGQNPGHTEDVQGLPFLGPSGRLLQDVYMDGIYLRSLASVFVSNICRCFHVDGDSPPNKSFTSCRPHLIPDLLTLLSISSSLTIVTLGAHAATHLHALLGIPKASLSSALSLQGRTHSLPFSPSHSVTVFSTYHPAAILRSANLIYAVEGHLRLVLDHLTSRTPAPSQPTILPPWNPIS